MVKTRQWQLAVKPTDHIKLDGDDATFKLVEVDLPELKQGELLVKTVYLSNDPAQRGWIDKNIKPERLYVPPVQVGTAMHSRGLGQVVESKVDGFKKGDYVLGNTNWAEYAILDGQMTQPAPELPGLKRTQYLGALGTTGLTAYYGIREIAKVTSDDIVVVSGAAGAAGSMAVQIAKHLFGAKKVFGLAGTDEKCRWVETLGADKCFNYKDKDWRKQLKEATPDYVNVYFDNVGGEMLDFMLSRMARFGRVAFCGAISAYNTAEKYGLKNYFDIITMRLEVKGFIVLDYLHKAREVVGILVQAVKDGKIKLSEENETVVSGGFDDIPKTWTKLFEGGNTGKLVTEIK